MRAHYLTSVVLASTLSWLAACSSEVKNENAGGASGGNAAVGGNQANGGGGSGGDANTSGTTTVTTTSQPTLACDTACEKASTCGTDLCSQFQVDCEMVQADCFAACINGADCDAINSLSTDTKDTALEGCIGQCVGGDACVGCLASSCVDTSVAACYSDPDCKAWLQCAQACAEASDSDPSCFAACNLAHPDSESFYSGYYECACTSCATECEAQADPCHPVLPNGTGGSNVGGGATGGTGGTATDLPLSP